MKKTFSKKILIGLNIFLAFFILEKFFGDLVTHKLERFTHLQVDHLKYASMLLLEHHRNCQTLPTTIENPENLQKCIATQITNPNFTDMYNKLLFYSKSLNGEKALVAYYNNSTMFKTINKIKPYAIEVDTKNMSIRQVNYGNHNLPEFPGEPLRYREHLDKD